MIASNGQPETVFEKTTPGIVLGLIVYLGFVGPWLLP
jgi:hypothetical protein